LNAEFGRRGDLRLRGEEYSTVKHVVFD